MAKERVFYHGTLLENLESIKKNGLMPNTKADKNNWPKLSIPNSIYLTTELSSAGLFAGKSGRPCVILEIKESAIKGAKLIPDEAYGGYATKDGSWSFRVEGIIIRDFKVKKVIQK